MRAILMMNCGGYRRVRRHRPASDTPRRRARASDRARSREKRPRSRVWTHSSKRCQPIEGWAACREAMSRRCGLSSEGDDERSTLADFFLRPVSPEGNGATYPHGDASRSRLPAADGSEGPWP
jgi:hypothetical protein